MPIGAVCFVFNTSFLWIKHPSNAISSEILIVTFISFLSNEQSVKVALNCLLVEGGWSQSQLCLEHVSEDFKHTRSWVVISPPRFDV